MQPCHVSEDITERVCDSQHVVVSAEAAKAVSQHGQGLVQLPADVLQTLEGALAGG